MANDERSFSFLASTELASDNTSEEQGDAFWTHEEIDAARWNQVFPYQFILVKRGKDGKYFRQGDDTARNWVFTLPFPPESLSISMPFAISGQVTQGGYFEEHSGAPIRMISLSGTTGVLPLRPTAPTVQRQNLGQAIFAGTIQQAQRVATSAKNLASDFTGKNSNFAANLVDDDFSRFSSTNAHMAKTSGYYQFRKLQEFFENYAAFKKTEEGRDYRLAFAIWKQQAVYLVTPLAYNTSQAAGSPYEITYNIGLRAYRRISLDSADDRAANVFKPVVNKPNALAAALKALADARDILENSRDILSAVAGDLDHSLFEPMRQTMMFLRDALNVPLAFADLPVQVLRDCQDAVVSFIATEQAFSGASDTFKNRAQTVVDAYRDVATAAAATGAAETGGGFLKAAQSVSQNTDPAFDVFRNPQDNYDLFKDIKPSRVNLPPKAIRAIVNERERVRKLNRLSFEIMRDDVAKVAADFADAVGAGNSTFNTTFQRPNVAVSKTPSPSDFQVMFALNRVVMELNRLAASGNTNNRLRSVDFVAGLARRSGIAFRTPRSKFAVPYPYGVTLEQLATRYLGSPDRWIEIAALNGLRAPYVDEEGFTLPLLVNGNGNQMSVADSSNLYVGQQVWIGSTTTPRTVRRITKIERLSESNSIITVDGDADLSRFRTIAGAELHAFLPDTVNSQMTIYIPSEESPATADVQTKDVPGLDVFDELLNAGGFDLLLTPTNDLAITPDGDCRLAVGLQNIVQTARIRLSVTQGSLNRHPSFGLPLKPGQSTADLDAKDLLKAVKNLFVDDPAFTGVQSASVLKQGPTAKIMLTVGVRGQSQLVPLQLDLRR